MEPHGVNYTLDRTHTSVVVEDLIRIPFRKPTPSQLRAKARAHIPEGVRWTVWERDAFRCRHCGKQRFLTLDHIVPVAKGGGDDLSNLQTLCRTCNSRKGAKDIF
jgi:5-methylcytosine-specific restriction endonuclease McrA